MTEISRLITVAAGFAMLIAGGVLTTRPETPWAVFGAVLVALGSAVLSLSVTETRRLEQAKEIVAPHLEPVCYQFLSAIAQLRQATKDFRDGAITDETAGELIAAHTSSLEETLRNLHAYSGVKSDRERFRLRRDQTRIDDDAVGTSARSEPVQTSTTARAGGARVQETVACPNCGAEHEVLLGLTVGDSASTSCFACQLRFHVHRDRHGEAFTKGWGSGAGREFEFSCPHCSRYRFKYAGQPEARYCLACYAFVEPSNEGGAVVREPSQPVQGVEVGQAAYGKSLLQCQECKRTTRAFSRYGGNLYAVCSGCRKLVRAPEQVEFTGGDQTVAPPGPTASPTGETDGDSTREAG